MNLKQLAKRFKRATQISICQKCGDQNPYMDYDPSYVCRQCKTRAKMWGGEKEKSESKIKTQPLDNTENFSNDLKQLAQIIMDKFKTWGYLIGKTEIKDNSVRMDINNITVDKRTAFEEDCDFLIANILGFNGNKFPDGRTISHLPDQTYYVKDDILITVNVARVDSKNLGGIIIGYYS